MRAVLLTPALRYVVRPGSWFFQFGPCALSAVLTTAAENPFALDQPQAYLRWRAGKLARAPRRVEDLIVEVRDLRSLRDSEVAEIRRICAAANMAVYVSARAGHPDEAGKDLVRHLGARLGLSRLQANPLADDDGVSSLEAVPEKSALGYIPYSNRRLLWHTDGYYNPPDQRIGAFILHCVRPAARGGENQLLDHEIAYLRLRDADPAYVRALCAPDAMTIPANLDAGVQIRPAQTGPVFSSENGTLHMRYTARTRSIEWRSDATTRAAVAFLNRLLDAASHDVLRLRLSAGQGLICNNVLHNRSAFDDPASGPGRLVYRARYCDRLGAP
jgi:alpha-ketoglutarate-dependent taurine dioxygenase